MAVWPDVVLSHFCLGILEDGWLGLRCISLGQQREESQALPDVKVRKDPEGGLEILGPKTHIGLRGTKVR